MLFYESGGQWNQMDVISLTIRKCGSEQPIMIACPVIIKIMKDYSLRQQENNKLSIENIRSKLQLLKMQIHPKIIFECLHNIYNDIEAGNQYAPEMILKLSDLLSYLLYEGELEKIHLVKEIKMIQNYIDLKKLEYKNKLDVRIEINGNISDYYIVPGLILPLLEIVMVPFEKIYNTLSVSIELKTSKSNLLFNVNADIENIQIKKMPSTQSTLDSIKKRLQISNAHKFKLEVNSIEHTITIIFQLELEKIRNEQSANIKDSEA